MGSSDTLRAVIDAGRASKRLDELSSARVIGKIAMKAHAAQQKAGAGKAVGPITPMRIGLAATGEATLEALDASSLGYSAPEQITGGSGDRRSDVFSLGAVMWEALTYQRLFDAMNDTAVKLAVQEREITAPAELNANIPAELSAICMRALSRNPTDRYQSLKAMAVEIEEFLEEAGYIDDDSKIAQYLAGMQRKPASSAVAPPIAAAPAPAAPAPAAPAPAAPSILTSEPARPKNTSGSALAAALANANASGTTNGAVAGTGLPAAAATSTLIGVPVASDWVDKTPQPHVAPPIAVAPPLAATSIAPIAAAPMPVPLTPRPPVLPSGSQSAVRIDKSTISGAAAPQLKVATTIEAKHVEAKPPAVIVDDQPQAETVDDPLDTQLTRKVPKVSQLAKLAQLAAEPESAESTRTTLVDSTPPAITNAVADAKAAEAKAAEATKAAEAEAAKAAAAAMAAQTAKAAEATQAHADEVGADANAVEAKVAGATAAEAKTDAKLEAKTEAKTEATGTADTERVKKETGPNPAAAVSLPRTGRESKADLLAGWGWGTDKQDAIAPAGYAPDDDDDYQAPSSKKTLTYVIGGGLAVVLLLVVVVFAFGGSSKKAKPSPKQIAAEKAKREAEALAAAQPTPPQPTPPPAPVEQPGSAAATGSGSAVVDDAAVRAAAETAAAEQAAADKLAQEKAAADEAEAARLAKMNAADRKKAEAAQAKLDAEAARTAEADRKKAEAAQAKLDADAAQKLEADKKAEAKRIAQEEATRKKTEADAARAAKRAETDAARAAQAADAAKNPKTTTTAARTTDTKTTTSAAKSPDAKTTTTKKTVAAAETKPRSDVNPETAYRQGLQAFARGDTTAALASLRSSLAANPNYAPTWRGLGLVFEKMGEKDQAKAAYRRYLQLVPTAGDSEIIRGRLERLGS